MRRFWLISILAVAASSACAQVRIKDIAWVAGARHNQLTGFGLVVGLEGTGDGNSTPFTPQSLANMLQKYKMSIPAASLKTKNVAAVVVTADLPPFVKMGATIDVTVSSIGDAKSLQGGMLLQTPLQGANDQIIAVAQGPLSIGGFNFSAGGSSSQKNHVAVGRISAGAIVEQEVPTSIVAKNIVTITLRDADFTTAGRVAEAINRAVPEAAAKAADPYSITVNVPTSEQGNLVGFLGRIESLAVVPDVAAKIVVNERTGTIVVGGNVRITACTVGSGGISVKIENTPVVAIPPPFSENGKPVILPQKDVKVKEDRSRVAAVPSATTVEDVVKALNALGVSPRDLINVLQAMKQAGAITADIEMQ